MMKILLPPSETKRPDGQGAPLDLASLALPQLTAHRLAALDALEALSADPSAAQRVLKLGARQLGDIDRNRALRTAATLPAIDRYTGVLYDALNAPSLGSGARGWLGDHVWIHSALFGVIGALDAIPSYRLSAGTSLPGVAPLRRHWASGISAAIEAVRPRFVLDMRSDAYAALGPVPEAVGAASVRVVTDEGGSARALNHFNKKAKGEFVHTLAADEPTIESLSELLAWCESAGIRVRETQNARQVELVV